jgi:hypothetical protein
MIILLILAISLLSGRVDFLTGQAADIAISNKSWIGRGPAPGGDLFKPPRRNCIHSGNLA